MSAADVTPTIIVGVIPGKAAAIVPTAVAYAERFGADLVFAFVDAASAVASPVPDATFVAPPLDPEVIDEIEETGATQLSDEVAPLLAESDRSWTTTCIVGDTARSLIDLADEHETIMFVVGTREGWRGSVHEFFNGSIAARLSHWQHRPVVVVPRAPKSVGSPLPWNRSHSEPGEPTHG